MKRIHNGRDVPPEPHRPWVEERREAARIKASFHQDISDGVCRALGCTTIDRSSLKKLRQASDQIARFVLEAIEDELTRLRKIEAAAIDYRRSLEDDGWTKDAIEQGLCRPGLHEMMKLVPSPPLSNGDRA